MRAAFSFSPPSLDVLSTMDNDQLCQVAKMVALSHYFKQLELPAECVEGYLHLRHEYGVELDFGVSKTQVGQMARLRNDSFWREHVNAAADFHREHLAMRNRELGDSSKGLTPYCSDATYDMFESRSKAIMSKMSDRHFGQLPGITKASLYQNSLRAKYNQLYITGKAMAALAQERGYSWALITLTCPPSFHPISAEYNGSSFKDGYDYLNDVYRKLFKCLGNSYKANRDYFGIRVVEAHKDGCPHWHLVLFSTENFFTKLKKKLKAIYSASNRSAVYFEQNQDEIVKLSSEGRFVGTPLSYIHKHLAFGLQRVKTDEEIIASKRNLYAIKSAGVRQFQTIGTNGLATKLRVLRMVARCHDAPEHLKAMAAELVQESSPEGRSTQLAGVVGLLSHKLDEIEMIRIAYLNCYGEKASKLVAVKHTSDLIAHDLSLCSLPNLYGGAVTFKELNIEIACDVDGSYPLYSLTEHSQRPGRILSNYEIDNHYYLKTVIQTLQFAEPSQERTCRRLRWRPPWRHCGYFGHGSSVEVPRVPSRYPRRHGASVYWWPWQNTHDPP